MHYKNNICENMVKIIVGEKNTMAVSRDMEELGVRPQL
jgi:hypothetical protein